jgi:cardiolipin synthase
MNERGGFAALALSLSLLILAACASVPDISPAVGQVTAAEPVQIVGPRGPLSERQIKAVTDRLTAGPQQDALLQKHLAIEQAISETPLVAGEQTRLLRDGVATFSAMFAAMRSAKSQIDLEYYILEDVESDGVKLSDLLLAKRQEGVEINIIYDGYGSSDTPKAFFDRLKDAGVKIVNYNPIDPLKAKAAYDPNRRDHRKILIVDGTTAIVGGVNLSTTYQPNPVGKSGNVDNQPAEHWRDTDLEIKGPAAAQLQALFVDHWREQHGSPFSGPTSLPAPPAAGGAVVRILGSSPKKGQPLYYVTLISAIRSAEKSITASAAYFAPTRDEMRALKQAARRGVDVRLLLPDRSDSALSLAVGHSHYEDLMEAGVKIYETHNLVLHSKTVVVDGVWSVVGSSNFDHRSVIFNDEVDAVVLGGDTARGLQAMFDDDYQTATQVDPRTWRRRPVTARLRETYAKLWQKFL